MLPLPAYGALGEMVNRSPSYHPRWSRRESSKLSLMRAGDGVPDGAAAVAEDWAAGRRARPQVGPKWVVSSPCELSAVPTGLGVARSCFPGMNAWASFGCPSGTPGTKAPDPLIRNAHNTVGR